MKENDVTEISQLFGLQKDIVEGSEKDGTLGQRMKDVISKRYTDNATLDKFKENFKADIINAYYNDLVEKSKKGDTPQELYKPIKGSVLQQKEREWSKKTGVTEYSDFDDLIEKAIGKTTANGKTLPEYEKTISELKTANLKLVKEKDEAVQTIEAQYKNMSIERDKLDAINKVPFDFSGHKADEVDNVKMKTQNILKSVFDADYKLDYDDKKRLVVIKDGKIVKNQATLDPVSVSDVMIEVAKDYNLKLISPDKGGQGGQSSTKSGLGFTDTDSFIAYCKANNMNPMSKEAVALYKQAGLVPKK